MAEGRLLDEYMVHGLRYFCACFFPHLPCCFFSLVELLLHVCFGFFPLPCPALLPLSFLDGGRGVICGDGRSSEGGE